MWCSLKFKLKQFRSIINNWVWYMNKIKATSKRMTIRIEINLHKRQNKEDIEHNVKCMNYQLYLFVFFQRIMINPNNHTLISIRNWVVSKTEVCTFHKCYDKFTKSYGTFDKMYWTIVKNTHSWKASYSAHMKEPNAEAKKRTSFKKWWSFISTLRTVFRWICC